MSQRQKLTKKILKILQSDFPLTKRPYLVLADRLGIKEPELILRIKQLHKNGTIRRIGAVASARHLGYKNVLLGVKVLPKKIKETVCFINSYENVTHNYLRNSTYNIWLTFSAKTKKEINDFIRRLKRRKGVKDILILPSKKVFKIKAEFKF